MSQGRKLPISLVVIAANEERNLPRCLKAANFCSEMVVVDSGSTDRTAEIAQSFGARVIHRPWNGYQEQKNFACQQASQPWILCIDADEVVSPELRDSIARTFLGEPPVDGYELNRHSVYAGQRIDHGGWYPQWRLLLYKRGAATWGGMDPHPRVMFDGRPKARLAGDLFHYTYSDVAQHVSKNFNLARAAATAMRAQGRHATIAALLVRPPWAAFRSYVVQRGFLSGFYGLTIAVVTGFYTFQKYAMLREMEMREKRHETRQDNNDTP